VPKEGFINKLWTTSWQDSPGKSTNITCVTRDGVSHHREFRF